MEVIYQVLPRIWGKGKFSDWDAKTFDYLKTLSVSAIWYTGVIRHASGQPWVKGNAGSPYSISDYHDVNPYLADNPLDRMEEFESLVRRTHHSGLRVIIDYVPNHVAKDCKDVPLCSYHDYDWTDTLKIDYNHPETWGKMLEIALFWASKGVDGFRCDMVEMVPIGFLKWLVCEVRKRYPSFTFIGEAYEKANYRPLIKDAGFDLLYDKSGLYDCLRTIICRGASARNITRNWQSLQDLQPHMLNFLENHDEQRFASTFFAGDAFKAFGALAAGALFNRASYMIYAGQEIGADASEGAEGRTSIFDFKQPEELSKLYSYIHGRKALASAQQELLRKYRALLSNCSSPVFSKGANYDLCWCNSVLLGFDPEKHFAFLRYYRAPRRRRADAVLVACNLSAESTTFTLNIPEDLRSMKELAHLPAKVQVSLGSWDTSILSL